MRIASHFFAQKGFARIKSRKASGFSFDRRDECFRFGERHRAGDAVRLEIEDEQIGRGRVDGGEKMFDLLFDISFYAEMIRAPKKSVCQRTMLSSVTFRVNDGSALRGFVNDTDDAV